MALSEVAKGAGVAPAQAPAVGTATPNKKGKDDRHAKLAAEGSAIRQKMSDEEKQLEGSKSDKVAFIGALGDPNKPQFRKEDGKDIPSFVVVGYAFKALEDMVVPRANLKSGFKNFMDVDAVTEEHVSAGQTFYLNVFETGALISKPAYAGAFKGEGTEVTLAVKYSQNRVEPLPVLNKTGKGSVKENMILVADMVGADESKGVKGNPQVKAEFADKFGVLYERRVAGKKGTSAGSKQSGEATKDLAAAFNAYLTKRG